MHQTSTSNSGHSRYWRWYVFISIRHWTCSVHHLSHYMFSKIRFYMISSWCLFTAPLAVTGLDVKVRSVRLVTQTLHGLKSCISSFRPLVIQSLIRETRLRPRQDTRTLFSWMTDEKASLGVRLTFARRLRWPCTSTSAPPLLSLSSKVSCMRLSVCCRSLIQLFRAGGIGTISAALTAHRKQFPIVVSH